MPHKGHSYYVVEQTKHIDYPCLSGYVASSEREARESFCNDTGYKYDDTKIKYITKYMRLCHRKDR
jgi:hypothetical protein